MDTKKEYETEKIITLKMDGEVIIHWLERLDKEWFDDMIDSLTSIYKSLTRKDIKDKYRRFIKVSPQHR